MKEMAVHVSRLEKKIEVAYANRIGKKRFQKEVSATLLEYPFEDAASYLALASGGDE